MKIAVLAPVWFPVPPTGYGGIEWIVSLLADGLVDAGHDVTLFASGDSHTKAKLVSVYDEAPSRPDRPLVRGAAPRARLLRARLDEFDVINDHSGPPAAALGQAVRDAGDPHGARPARRPAGRAVRASSASSRPTSV